MKSLIKLAVFSLTISCLSLACMSPNQSDKVRQHVQVLKNLSEEDKSKFAIYQNCIPDIQRIIRYQAYAQALYEAKSIDALFQLLTQIKELKEQYNDSQDQQVQHPYSFEELEKLGKAELLELALSKIEGRSGQYLKQNFDEKPSQAVQALMQYGVYNNNTDLIKVAAYFGANVNDIFPSYLHRLRINLKTAQLLIELGADVNSPNTGGYTPLHTNILNGRVDMAELLIKSGANANTQSSNGSTPLREATLLRNNNLVKMLQIRQIVDDIDRERIAKRQKTNKN